MQQFDCLSKSAPLFGPHLLEASAGTGKTFSIEHIYVRLILESIDLEEILVVTFTRAATRELKARLRSNLEKALLFLTKDKSGAWDYLEPYLGSDQAARLLGDALAAFDRSQIFTIHGFCFRMLNEFAFEAKAAFSFSSPDGERQVPERLRRAARDFLESGINGDLLCPEQAAILFKKFQSLDEIQEKLLRQEKAEAASFSERFEECKAALQGWKGLIEEAKLVEDFIALQKGYKTAIKGDFEKQIRSIAKMFAEPEGRIYFRDLLREKGTVFDFLSPENRKIKAGAPSYLHYPGFFDWARASLGPFFDEKPKKILQILQKAWLPIAEKILSEEPVFSPDEILQQMKKGIENKRFASKIRGKYKAAIIDEFQDTDAVQWAIFQELFLKESEPLTALYLVGDPKQSIYRFRKADVYTYLKARDFLGEQHLYHLDTNFRSSKNLIGALNALFCRDWLYLPQAKRTLPFQPVKAGLDLTSSFNDEKGALHLLLSSAPADSLFDEVFLPFAVKEILKMRSQVKHLSAFAILVKDRYQGERALQTLRRFGVSAIARSHASLGNSLAFQALEELFEAILSPRSISKSKIVMAGPFGPHELPLSDFKSLLEEKGMVFFFRAFLDCRIGERSMKEEMIAYDLSFYRDAIQIFEELIFWERNEGFSFEGLKRRLKHLKNLDPEEGGCRRLEADEEAVQIMTLHTSKGLEFDIVFALGLATRTPEAEEGELEEMNAEKQRLLYVAMTRAKRRLYAPVSFAAKEAKPGGQSPMELFCHQLEKEGPLMERFSLLSKKESVTYEKLDEPLLLNKAAAVITSEFPPEPILIPAPAFSPSYISSFTSLAQAKEKEGKVSELSTEISLHTLPRGTETGIAIHSVFEKLFSSSHAVWRSEAAIRDLVLEELKHSSLAPWIEPIQKMVWQTLSMPLQVEGEFFSLSQLNPSQVQVEMEFLFTASPHFIKGFIDLVFSWRGKYYFLDWKTNWLGDTDKAYEQGFLQAAMEENDYFLQAALYSEALCRYLGGEEVLGGAFYFFVRGGAVFHFYPNSQMIESRYAKC